MRVDETYRDGVLIEALTHHGDGTGTLAVLTDGVWVESEVSGLPTIEDPQPSPEERIAQLESQLAVTAGVLAELLDTLGGQ